MTDIERLSNALEHSEHGCSGAKTVDPRKVTYEFFNGFTEEDFINFNKALENDVKRLYKERYPSLPRKIFNKLKNIFTGGK